MKYVTKENYPTDSKAGYWGPEPEDLQGAAVFLAIKPVAMSTRHDSCRFDGGWLRRDKEKNWYRFTKYAMP